MEDVIYSFVPLVNIELEKPYKNPIIDIIGLKGISFMLQDEL